MKESKNLANKKNLYFTILNKLKQGTNLSKIKEDFSISKQKLNYYLNKLKKDGYIKNKGYGYYEVKDLGKDTINSHTQKLIRGHAFIWTIKLPQEIKGWDKRIEILEKNKIKFKLIGVLKTTPRIFINNKKIWLGNKTLTIFEPNSFYGNNAIQSRKYAVFKLLSTLEAFERKFNINIKPYTFKPAREHYGLIKNDLAIQCNKKGEKIHVRDDLEGEWLWIDNSESLGELETGGKKALTRNIQVQKWWNDNKKHNFQVTPTFLMESINKLTAIQIETNNQLFQYAEQNKQHLKLIQEYRKENRFWRNNQIKKMKKELKSGYQSKLKDFIYLK